MGEPLRKRRSEKARRDDKIAEAAHERLARHRRTLPHSLDAEASVLGGVILAHERMRDPAAFTRFMARIDWLEADDFYDPRHRSVFAAVRQLFANQRPIDVVTLEVELERMERLEAVGGVAFLGDLAASVPTPDNVVHYAEVVRERRILRAMMEAASEVIELGLTHGDVTPGEMQSRLAEAIAYVNHRQPIERGRFLGEIVAEVAQSIRDVAKKERETGERQFVGIPTGLDNVDDLIGGQPYGLPMGIVGRSASGKTSLIQQIVEYQAWWLHQRGDKRLVVMASNEDAEGPFSYRAIANYGAIDSQAVRRAQINAPEAMEAFERGVAQAIQSRIYFMPIHGKTAKEVVADLDRLHAEHGIASAWIDYVNNMTWPEYARDEQTATQENTKVLVAFQGRTGCALGIGAQLGRELDDRPWNMGGPVPRKKDIRGSGYLDIAIKVLIALYHPWAHSRPVSWSEDWRQDPRDKKGKTFVDTDYLEGLLLKNSLGREDEKFEWDYVRKFARFATHAKRQPTPPQPSAQRAPRGAPHDHDDREPPTQPAPAQLNMTHPNAPGAE